MAFQIFAIYFFIGSGLYLYNSIVHIDPQKPTDLKTVGKEVFSWPKQIWPLSLLLR